MAESDDSDYIVEYHVKPDKISKRLINDESADILGNFDDAKRRRIEMNGDEHEENPFANETSDLDPETDNSENEEEVIDDAELRTSGTSIGKTKQNGQDEGEFGEDQITSLLRGVSKANRFVLYVTNLNFATSKERLTEYFSSAGPVKAVRIPKKRKGGFAFIEMSDVNAFKNALTLHNTTLDERPIKVQLSEAGKKKSANKKNILKQKNRKLAEMRNESKQFTKSGKNYDKSIKKEMEKEKLQQAKMWARRKAKRNNTKKTNAV